MWVVVGGMGYSQVNKFGHATIVYLNGSRVANSYNPYLE